MSFFHRKLIIVCDDRETDKVLSALKESGSRLLKSAHIRKIKKMSSSTIQFKIGVFEDRRTFIDWIQSVVKGRELIVDIFVH